MSNPADTGTAEDEKKTNDLLALLYPDEGGQVDADRYEDDDELAGMRSLRALFQEVSDQEPSDAVSNKLMALAAQHAPVAKSESRGLFAWFSDLLLPLVAHPGLAAAATLVLLVGVAGTLYVKGGATVAEPTASSQAVHPTASAEQLEEQAAPVTPAATSLDESPAEEAAEGEAYGLEDDLANDLERRSLRGRDSKAQSAKRKAAPADVGGLLGGSARGKGGKTLNPAQNSDHFEFADPPPGTAAADKSGNSKLDTLKVKDIDTRDFSSGSAQGGASQAPSAEPPPPPPVQKKPAPAKPARTRSSPSPEPTDDEDRDEATEKKRESAAIAAARLHEQARTAAKNNDCVKVNSLGQQIRKLDSAYYDRSFLSDAALKSCRQATSKKAKALE